MGRIESAWVASVLVGFSSVGSSWACVAYALLLNKIIKITEYIKLYTEKSA